MKKYILALLLMYCFVPTFAQTIYVGAWNPIIYPAIVGQCGWETQDNLADGTITNPYASWSKAWSLIDAANTMNQTVEFLPDAYLQDVDYDGIVGIDNCLGHTMDASAVIGASMSGLTIGGSTDGCGSYINAGSGSNAIHFMQINGADNVTVHDIYFKNFAQAFTVTDAQNVVFTNCIFDKVNFGVTALDGILVVSQNRNTTVTFNNCKFIDNTYNTTVDAIKVESNSTNPLLRATINLNGCEFICNHKNNSGGAFMLTGRTISNALPTELNITGGVFGNSDVTSSGKGGALYIGNNCKVSITGTKFYNNYSADAGGADGGGALYVFSDYTSYTTAARTDVTITDAIFYGNACNNTTSGGAIALQGASGHTNANRPKLTLTNTLFEGNSAAGNGGAIYNSYGELNINECYFTGNSAASGGAIYVKNATSVLNLTNSTFANDNNATTGKDVYSDVDILSSSNSFSSATNVAGKPFPPFPALDLFERANSLTVGNGWSQLGSASVETNQLKLGATANNYISRAVTAYTTSPSLTSGTQEIRWAFNFYGVSLAAAKKGYFVLASNLEDFTNASAKGYAVLLLNSTIKLISFNGGIQAANTTIISGSTLASSQTANVKVTYNPNTDEWKLYDAISGGSLAMSADPRSGLAQKGSTTVNTTHTAANLGFMGAYWTSSSTFSSNIANFDNIYLGVGTGIGAGWTGTYASPVIDATNYDCGSYCAMTVPGSCLALQSSNFVCELPNATGAISGNTFIDTDGDGLNDDGAPLGGLYVILYDDNGNVIGRTFTDASGNYSFTGLPDGTYHVLFAASPLSANPYPTAPNANNNSTPSTDSDIAINTFMSPPIVINSALGSTNSSDASTPAAIFTNVTAGFRNSPIILPAELLSFAGKIENCTENHLTWTTNHEQGISHFNVYERQENNEFALLGRVSAVGNTSELKNYQYDNEQIKPIAYYKLEVIDINQQMTNVNVIEVKNVCYEGITLLNNPVSDKVNLQFYNAEGNEAQVSIFDMSGKRMDFQTISVNEGLNHSAIKVENLSSGLYNLRIVYSNSAKVIRFIKE
jgi:predicted outer membrane repeat protein